MSETPRTLKIIAAFESLKGVLLLCIAAGLLHLLPGDVREMAEALVAHVHLDPEHGLAQVFLSLAANVTEARLWLLSGVALVYAGIRLAIGWGLWHQRMWAYWLGACAGLIYVPLELLGIADHPSGYRVAVLAINIAIVTYLARGIRTGIAAT